MVNFPILKQLDIDGYGLYPGTAEKPGLHIDFSKQGLTLVLGANGLGKSTLINILFRMLSGPFDLAKFDQNDELGNLNIIAAERKDLKSFFSDRVSDNATDAKCTLIVDFDNTTLSVTRNLSNLSIIDIKIGQTLLPLSNRVNDEELFQDQIQGLSNVSSFGDWLLILHYIVFYQENRRALVWDTSAQRELLRILLLDNEKSIQWKELTRKVLELDSDFRNLRNTVNKQIKKIKENFQTPEDKTGHRNQIGVLKGLRAETVEYINKLQNDLDVLSNERSTIRSLQLRYKQEIDSIERDIENNKVKILDSTLPKADDTLLFILATINSQKDIFGASDVAGKKIERLQKLIQYYLSNIFKIKSDKINQNDIHEKIKYLE
ncbi:AAA family ATPase, partial [Candidatus Symbiopectobacterium sp. NZEC135]|uniref:AAA family ATPase n=1 Tax=Candidatus Symbiopectobacterium sp. NZEC135 TaxID=2820471 RepID=UPI002226445F